VGSTVDTGVRVGVRMRPEAAAAEREHAGGATIEQRLTRLLALQLRAACCSWLDAPMVLAATLFTTPVTEFAIAFPLALLLVEPSLPWLVCGVCPSVSYAVLALRADRRAGGMNMSSLARAGDFAFIGVWLGALLITTRGVEMVATAFAGTLLAQRVNQILKKLVRRPRPPRAWSDRFSYRGYWTDVRGWSVNESQEGEEAESAGSMPPDSESFPSGDAAQAGMMATVLYLYGFGVCGPAVLCVLVAIGRTYFGCHWLGDSCAGCVQGALTTWLLANCIGWHDFHHDELSFYGMPLMGGAILGYYLTAALQKLAGLV
jgi:membrane-associated phospholipid phosphatase